MSPDSFASDPKAIVRKSFQAYVDNDRAGIESVIGSPFSFTSPLDNRIDRDTYFARCWPNNETIAHFRFVRFVPDGDQVFVTYEMTNVKGERFRNTEIFTVVDDKITEVEVYFGWSIPHDAPAGKFVDAPSDSKPQ